MCTIYRLAILKRVCAKVISQVSVVYCGLGVDTVQICWLHFRQVLYQRQHRHIKLCTLAKLSCFLQIGQSSIKPVL